MTAVSSDKALAQLDFIVDNNDAKLASEFFDHHQLTPLIMERIILSVSSDEVTDILRTQACLKVKEIAQTNKWTQPWPASWVCSGFLENCLAFGDEEWISATLAQTPSFSVSTMHAVVCLILNRPNGVQALDRLLSRPSYCGVDILHLWHAATSKPSTQALGFLRRHPSFHPTFFRRAFFSSLRHKDPTNTDFLLNMDGAFDMLSEDDLKRSIVHVMKVGYPKMLQTILPSTAHKFSTEQIAQLIVRSFLYHGSGSVSTHQKEKIDMMWSHTTAFVLFTHMLPKKSKFNPIFMSHVLDKMEASDIIPSLAKLTAWKDHPSVKAARAQKALSKAMSSSKISHPPKNLRKI